MLSALSMLAMSGHPLPTSATFVVGGHAYTVTVQYLPDTEQRCLRAALYVLDRAQRHRADP
jgi:hypothetical protein